MAHADNSDETFPVFPLTQHGWQALVDRLQLPPQQARIVELVLQNYGDKQIAAQLGLKVPTVRTYLRRTFDRLQVNGRLELVLKLFAASNEIIGPGDSHHRR